MYTCIHVYIHKLIHIYIYLHSCLLHRSYRIGVITFSSEVIDLLLCNIYIWVKYWFNCFQMTIMYIVNNSSAIVY